MSTTTAAEFIVVAGINLATPSASEEARKRRDALVASARAVTDITTPAVATQAAEVLKALKNFTGLIEHGRKMAKEPVLELGKAVDGLAFELAGKAIAEASRISKQLGAYQAEQNRIAEEARQKAWEEEQRILREAERIEREKAAAALREQEELARKALRARSDEKAAQYGAQLQAAADRSDSEREARQEATSAKIVETRVAAIAPPKPAGVATRKDIKFEVTDIQALYDSCPALVLLSPNNAAIKAVLKQNPGKNLPGVRHWEEAAAIVR